MGIQDLYKVFKDECPEILIERKLSKFVGYRFAIDISIFLYKYIRTAGPSGWIDLFLLLLCNLKKNGIKTICIHDGPNPPPEKRREQENRRMEVEKLNVKIYQGKIFLKFLLENFLPDNISPSEIDHLKKVAGNIKSTKKFKTFDELKNEIKKIVKPKRGDKIDTINYNDPFDVAEGLKISIKKWELQAMPITEEYKIKAKELIEYMGLAQIQADGEAETLCAWLCIHGHVDAVLSEDTDVLAYGTPLLLSKINITSGTITAIYHENVLNGLCFAEYAEFRDLCILLSCDYNDRVRGYPPDGKNHKKPVNIGYKGALCCIREYKTLEEVENYLEDADPLIYRRCRDLFNADFMIKISDLDVDIDKIVPYNKQINKKALEEFLKKNNARTKIEYIENLWKPTELVFNKK